MSEAKQKKPFFKKWWFIAIVVVVIVAVAGSQMSKGKDSEDGSKPTSPVATDKAKTTNKAPEPTTTTEAPKVKGISDGQHKVGTDIEPGFYKVEVSKSMMGMAYVERSKDAKGEVGSILANIILHGDSYVRILETDAFVKITGATLSPFDPENAEQNYKDVYEDGGYLVGIDIEPGEYKVEVIDDIGIGYLERLKDATFGISDIISNDLIQENSYVEIAPDDFMIRLQGVKLTKSK